MKKLFLIICLILVIFQLVVLATAIDIGSAAIERANGSNNHTFINEDNPANASGKITSIEIYVQTNATDVQVATFYEESPNYWTTRDTQYIGDVTAGAKRTFAVDLDVEEGDHIGAYANQFLYYNTSGGSGIYIGYGDYIPCSNQLMTKDVAAGLFSLYGTGETEEGANILFIFQNF